MRKSLIWAHRGASGYAPENTMIAFEKAIEMNADGIELDVQLSKDGKIIVLHDEKVDRVSDTKGWVKDYTLSELKKINVNKKYPEFGEAKIPTLEEVYTLIKDTNLMINVELKNGVWFYPELEEKVLALTSKFGLEERVVYSSFNHYSVLKLKELNPDTKTAFLYSDGLLDMAEYAERYGVEALHPSFYHLQYQNFIRECKERNILIRAWTVNKRNEMQLLRDNEIDIITNYPDIGRKVVDEYE